MYKSKLTLYLVYNVKATKLYSTSLPINHASLTPEYHQYIQEFISSRESIGSNDSIYVTNSISGIRIPSKETVLLFIKNSNSNLNFRNCDHDIFYNTNMNINNNNKEDENKNKNKSEILWKRYIAMWTNRYNWATEKDSIVFLRLLIKASNELTSVMSNCIHGVLILLIMSMDAVEIQTSDQSLLLYLYIHIIELVRDYYEELNNLDWTYSYRNETFWDPMYDSIKLDIHNNNKLWWFEPFIREYTVALGVTDYATLSMIFNYPYSGFSNNFRHIINTLWKLAIDKLHVNKDLVKALDSNILGNSFLIYNNNNNKIEGSEIIRKGNSIFEDPDLRIFSYDPRPWESILNPGRLTCMKNSQWSFETFWHYFFETTPLRTEDPFEADFFFVPIYSMCARVITNTTSDLDTEFRYIVTVLREQSPFFDRKRASDHIFVFVDDVEIFFPSWKEFISESIFLSPDALLPGSNLWHYPILEYEGRKNDNMFNIWKDIAVPSYTEYFSYQSLSRFNIPLLQRDVLYSFVGRHGGVNVYYKGNTVRNDIFRILQTGMGLIAENVEDAFELKGRSVFCLVPHGTSVWTNQLLEAIFAGCIPVILADDLFLPFGDRIPWERISIRWPQNRVDILEEELSNLFQNEKASLEEMRREISRYSCWLNYNSDIPGCSPYVAVSEILEGKAKFLRGVTFDSHSINEISSLDY